jgi:hypothetical protein
MVVVVCRWRGQVIDARSIQTVALAHKTPPATCMLKGALHEMKRLLHAIAQPCHCTKSHDPTTAHDRTAATGVLCMEHTHRLRMPELPENVAKKNTAAAYV